MRNFITTLLGKKKREPARPQPIDILTRVQDVTGLTFTGPQSKSQGAHFVAARALFAKVCYSHSISDGQVSEMLSRDRTISVYYRNKYKPTNYYKKFEKEYEQRYGKIES